ncbi:MULTISPECIES: AtpZ/AtpI family protein [Alteribacter]|uniref:AtpZ/AtpI family protein n=1 Tax=Alteribacter keqinensis TaxID=2483800 RepID=A0A3M7TQW9_9BACI|nr:MULTISPECIES: AtpZ/AtpI family protein [Alteribacter]MBM7095585.1 AtpZ/AtpI family protein [Alteribacter salitolerans]RNA67821.1 AtpZ/AtpI family protein [Alteribacter keqinensis]
MADEPQFKSLMRKMALVSTITSYLIGAILVGVLGGRWLDQHYETGGLLLALGFVIGLGAGVYGIYQVLKRFMGDDM